MKKLTINASSFNEWYWDYDMLKEIGYHMLDALNDDGVYTVTNDAIFNNCEYVPIGLINEIDGGTNEELEALLMGQFEDEEIWYDENNQFLIGDVTYQIELLNN